MGPIRELGMKIRDTPLASVRPIQMKDFASSLEDIRPSTSPDNLEKLIAWNAHYGSTRL